MTIIKTNRLWQLGITFDDENDDKFIGDSSLTQLLFPSLFQWLAAAANAAAAVVVVVVVVVAVDLLSCAEKAGRQTRTLLALSPYHKCGRSGRSGRSGGARAKVWHWRRREKHIGVGGGNTTQSIRGHTVVRRMPLERAEKRFFFSFPSIRRRCRFVYASS